MTSLVAPVEPGQFDDAPELQQNEQTLNREGGAYIDTYDFEDDEDLDEDDDEDFEEDLDDTYNDNRVEDEDWEIAERGMSLFLPINRMELS